MLSGCRRRPSLRVGGRRIVSSGWLPARAGNSLRRSFSVPKARARLGRVPRVPVLLTSGRYASAMLFVFLPAPSERGAGRTRWSAPCPVPRPSRGWWHGDRGARSSSGIRYAARLTGGPRPPSVPLERCVPRSNAARLPGSSRPPSGGATRSRRPRGSYLVDPASSHMLVSKIKPCMCKYELIQTVKLRMAH